MSGLTFDRTSTADVLLRRRPPRRAEVLEQARARPALSPGGFVELLGRPLRLLVLCYETPPIGGGTGVACMQVLHALAHRTDLHIDMISSGPGRRLEVVHQGSAAIHLLPVGKRDLNHWRPDELCRWMVGAVRRATELMRDEPYDLCHCWSGFPAGLVGWWLRHRQPYLVSLRGSDVPGYNRRLRLLDPLLLGHIARRVWRDAAGVVAVSRSLQALAQRTATDLPIGILPNGVDADHFRPGANGGSPSLVFAGRLIPRKGVAFLLDAVAMLKARHAGLNLTIAGDGPERGALETRCQQLGIGPQVTFTGRLDRGELARLLGRSGILVLPAVADAMPNVVLEGMAAGMAIVATQTSAAGIVHDNGAIVPPGDPTALAAAIERYLVDPALLVQHQRRSRVLALGRSWDAVADDHLGHYLDALARGAPRPQDGSDRLGAIPARHDATAATSP
ncbi:MAG: glycosyltransferase family 4 protein [Geminicoccaceae bacterium]